MPEINENDVKFDFTNRPYNINVSDYKDNKKFKFLAKYLSGENFMAKLDTAPDSKGIITQKEIQNLLSSDDKLAKHGISEQDLIDFIDNVQQNNPTKEETLEAQLESYYKDENGKTIMTQELKDMFGLKFSNLEITDRLGNVKKGFEIFDLNNDGQIDNIEEEFMTSQKLYKSCSRLQDLQNYLRSLDASGSDNGSTDGVITTQDKQKLYNKFYAENQQKQIDNLRNNTLKDENGNPIITGEVKNLFNKDKLTADYSEITDENGRLKSGYGIFDLNGDGMLDDKEKTFFSSGGHPSGQQSASLDISKFMETLSVLDNLGFNQTKKTNESNGIIPQKDKARVYKILSAAGYMLKNLNGLPENLQKSYADALKKVNLRCFDKGATIGQHINGTIYMNTDLLSSAGASSTLIHELTHYVLASLGEESSLTQEVQSFYMEYLLYKNESGKTDYREKSSDGSYTTDTDYMRYIDKLKEKYPDLSDTDAAVSAFIKYKYELYDGNYNEIILDGRVIEPSGNYTREGLKTAEYNSLFGVFEPKAKDVPSDE